MHGQDVPVHLGGRTTSSRRRRRGRTGVAAEYRDRAPRRIRLATVGDAVVNEGQPMTYGGTSWYGGASRAVRPTRIVYDDTPGTGGPEQRLREMDEDGIDAEVLFALGVRNRAIRDTEAFLAVIRGFNDYFAEEYCAVDPERSSASRSFPMPARTKTSRRWNDARGWG